MKRRSWRRIFTFPWRSPARDVDAELRFHLKERTADLRERGLSAEEADAVALREFGDVDSVRVDLERIDERMARRAHRHHRVDGLLQDLRGAWRSIRRAPALAAIAIGTLATGIGANTAIFTVVHRLLISPLPYQDGDRIVALTMTNEGNTQSPAITAVKKWRDRSRSFDEIAAAGIDAIMVQDADEQDTVHAFITSNYLHVLRLQPAFGRAFTVEDEQPGSPRVAMITYGLWQRAYGGRSDVLGAVINIDSIPHTIVGVTPPAMAIPMSFYGRATSKLHEAVPSIWVPASLDSIGGEIIARLRRGVTPAAASKELQSILDADAEWKEQAKVSRAGPSCCAHVMRAQDFLDPNEARAVELLFGAVGVLLLIACANVANLLMARAWTRLPEFAVRMALGAGRIRLARLVLAESLSLALAGGVLGVGLAWLSLHVIIALRPPALANLAGVHMESAVLLWSVGISLLTGLVFGAAPALFAGSRSVGDVLRTGVRTVSGNFGARRMRSVLIVAEIALSLVLLVGAGLFVRSFQALEHTPLGFDPHNLVHFNLLLPSRGRMPASERVAFEQTILDRFRRTPGVLEAAIGTLPGEPYHACGGSLGGLEAMPDSTGAPRNVSGCYGVAIVTPDYFRVAGMKLIDGAAPEFSWGGVLTREIAREAARQPVFGDSSTPPTPIVVSRELARRLWPGSRAVGAQLRDYSPRGPGARYVVGGVAEDVHIPGRGSVEPQIYQMPIPLMVPLLVRTSGSPRDVVAALRRAVATTDSRVVAQTVLVGDEYIRDALAPTRFAMVLLAVFAGIALFLSGVGLFGVVSYAVSQRRREIGVRVALGARPGAVAAMFVWDGLTLIAIGSLLGVVGAFATRRMLAGLLYGITPSDPVTLASTCALVCLIGAFASLVPAWRALRVDPVEALRAE